MPEELLQRIASIARGSRTRVHVVGGYVRDLLLGREPLDLDLLVEGDATPFLEALSRETGSEPVILSEKQPITYRTSLGSTLVDLSACEKGHLREALARRDFTINTLTVPIEQAASEGIEAPVDPFGGMQDLRAKLIRHVSVEALDEDPVRLLRAVRLLVLLEGFRLESETERAIRERAASLRGAPVERLGMELEMILGSHRAGTGMRTLWRCDLLFTLFPDLEPLDGLQQNRWHDHDALEHTLRCVEEADRLQSGHAAIRVESPLGPEESLILKWSALLHDTGKASTAAEEPDGQIRFLGHETVSSNLAGQTLRRYRTGARRADRVRRLIANHLRLSQLSAEPRITERAMRRLVHDIERDTPVLALLAVADRRAAGGPGAEERLERLERTAALAVETLRTEGNELVNPRPLLTGTEVMQILDLPPGPRVGAILRWLTKQQVEEKLVSREEAVTLLRSLPPGGPDSEE